MNRLITSTSNDKVKAWRKLHQRKGRKQTQAFLGEGYHLLEEAWKSSQQIKEIIAEAEAELPEWTSGIPVERVSKEVFRRISQTQTPQGIAAVIQMSKEKEVRGDRLILLDRIQDPGNLGTIIRTADAAGMDGIVLGKGTADIYNDKVVRATQGSLFHLPFYEADLKEEVALLQQKGYEIWATALEDAMYYYDAEVPEKVALILGNEGAGVEPELIGQANKRISIPIYGKAESLNVSIAAGILMYHLRQ